MTNPSAPEFIYKVADEAVIVASSAAGRFVGMPIDLKDGYIHFSTARQLPETLRLHFAGQDRLVVFAVRTSDVAGALRWEPSRGGQLFPHLYGQLPMRLTINREAIAVAADGSVDLPTWIR